MKASPTRFLGVSLILILVLISAALGQGNITPRIINGVPTTDFESVGIVGTKELGQLCTGTLISPTHVLTATHAAELAQGPTDGTFEVNGIVYTTSHVYIHPDYNSHSQQDDIAIFELSEAIEDVTPSAIFRGTPQVGDLLTLVGYGAGGNGDTGQEGTFGVKMVGTTTIDAVTATLIIWRFDNNSESDTAYGDSGGPAYLEVDGEYLIAGVTSGGTDPDSMIGDISFDTRVDAFAGWIDAIVAGEEGGGTNPPECPPKHGKHPAHGPHPGAGKHPGNGFHPGGKHPGNGPHPGVAKDFEESDGPKAGFDSPLKGVADRLEDFGSPLKNTAGEKERSKVVFAPNRSHR